MRLTQHLHKVFQKCLLISDLCQGSKKVRDPGFAESKVSDLDGSWTLDVLFVVGLWKPRTSKLCYAARPWKPRTLKFGYVAETWKPRIQNLKIFMSPDLKDLGPYTIKYVQNFMLSIVPGSSTGDELGRSDSKNLNSKK